MDLQSPCPVTTVRRNPPRKAKQTSSTHALSSSKPSNANIGITPFPFDDILEPHPPKIRPLSNQRPKNSNVGTSSNLKVFLRIRPLECRASQASKVTGGEARAIGRVRAAKDEKRKNMSCLFVNSSSSVTLTAPASALESKRAKSEVYDGFSHVFPPESVQVDIYDRVMQPLVMDFMEGHSSLLVAMGPTGSGKTYTMFGSPQQLGIVPLAFRQIFSQAAVDENIRSSRTYYLSMFEIHSERGKAEKIFDLLPESVPHQQGGISSFKEVKISSVADAEKLIAHGTFKRSTAATNANNKSSRSQCIINVRCMLKSDTDDHSCTKAILTIADLAGAERERKTGNQGTRLLESNFINNTSMVFGQCLRSLLEHQKNPKKPIEKHFKNSLLTRYLQDYMEGKRQMTLILTVKTTQEDYMDTSFILRQASPYMQIKFYHLQENDNAPCQKRKAALVLTESSKRRKDNISELSLIDGDHVVMEASATSKISEKDSAGEEIGKQGNAELHIELQKIKRSEEVMRNFARALLSTLKQYKYKLKESENEVRYLKESLKKQRAQANKIEKELNEIRTLRSCPSKPAVEEGANTLSFNHGVSVSLVPSDPDNEQGTDVLPDETNTTLCPETSIKIEMDQNRKTVDGSLLDIKSTDNKGMLSPPLHQRTLKKVHIAAEACSRLPLEEKSEDLNYQYLDEGLENFQKLAQSYVQVGEMDDLVMNLSEVSRLKGPDGNAPVNIPLTEHEYSGETSNHSTYLLRPTVPLESEDCTLCLPVKEEISINQDGKYLAETPENLQKLAQSYVQVEEMDDVVKNLSEVSSLNGPDGNAPVNIPLTEHEYSGETSNHSACVPQPTVPLEIEDCTLCLPVKEEIAINPDGKCLDEDPENFQKLAQSYVQVGEMDDVVMNLSEVSGLKDGNASINIPLSEHEYSGETSNHSVCVSQPAVPLEREDCTFCLPVKEEISINQDGKYLDEDPENFQKLAQSYVQAGEMNDVVMNLSEVSSLKGPDGNALVNIPFTEHEYSGETSNQSACVPQPTVPLESEDCTLFLPVKEEISINQDGMQQSLEKVTLTENVRSATTYSTEALNSEKDDIALRPLNCQRPKRKLLPASAIHFKDFGGLFMDENAMEGKRKKTDKLKARSDGSISLIRILKSNLPR
ncbi:centromere-associated protein E isoform X3 [Phalaenopsis equestris]|uniref:centromere-associated protein E isoform X3 n=1 Tax=Phalaenopsis equestris TaxID=78828 RepID=UPI0009E519F7|nr:centromere-associated protein E isoform X3 [Phalaenopsis equestris]